MFLDPIDELASVASIGPDPLDGGRRFVPQALQDQLGTITVLDVCGMDDNGQQIAHGIDNNMPLAPFDPLACIIAAHPARFGCLDTLTVDDGRTGVRVTITRFPVALAQNCGDLTPRAVKAPLTEVIVHAVTVWIIARQILPLATAAHNIENGVDHPAHVQFKWASRSIVLQWQQGPNQSPFCIIHVAGVTLPNLGQWILLLGICGCVATPHFTK